MEFIYVIIMLVYQVYYTHVPTTYTCAIIPISVMSSFRCFGVCYICMYQLMYVAMYLDLHLLGRRTIHNPQMVTGQQQRPFTRSRLSST